MFKIAENDPAIKPRWYSTNGSSTYYVGQLVAYNGHATTAAVGTVIPLAVAAGAADTTTKQVIAGVVIGFNNRNPLSNSTGQYATGVTAQADQLARVWAGAEGMYSKGDPQLLVLVCPITTETILDGPIFVTTAGVAPAISTVTVATTDGFVGDGTLSACDVAPVANVASMYGRTGVNAGLIRVTNDTSTTVARATLAFPYDSPVGDTFVRVNLKQGLCRMQLNSTALFIDSKPALTSDYFNIIVENLDLAESGKERAQFRFINAHFDYVRA